MAASWSDFTIYVVRHGHRADKEAEYDGGWNTPLSERGREQAEHLADFLAERDLDSLYSSCQLRALETAAPTHRATGVDWHVWPVFCEFTDRTWRDVVEEDPEYASDVATWQRGWDIDDSIEEERERKPGTYYRLSDIEAEYPGVVLDQPFPYPDAWWRAEDAQTRTNGIARLELAAQALQHTHEAGDKIAVVCHNKSGDGLATALTEYPRRHQYLLYPLDNTGITRLDRREDGTWLVKYSNRIDHLPEDLRT